MILRTYLRHAILIFYNDALCDIDMPEINEIEAGKIVKKKYPDVSIIHLTVQNELGII